MEQRLQAATLLDGHARHIAGLARDLAGTGPPYSPHIVDVHEPVLVQQGLTEFAAFLALAVGGTSSAGTGDDDLTQETGFGIDCILNVLEALVARA
ncbi:MAG TPA: hypothetical protein VHN80_10560 [Kineosporiaceae bacterium]|nr:hypothetical protein [Kineosporiaceae bacterium]